MNTLLIAGTDAKVGKTAVMMALMAYWQRYCSTRRLGIMKPIEDHKTSTERDCDLLIRLFGLDQSSSEITPVTLKTDGFPAAMQTGQRVELNPTWQQLQQLQQRDFVLVEAWGGLGSPLTSETTVADLARDWHLPTLLVVPVQPGTVTHAVAHVALANQSQIHLKGIILNANQPCDPDDWQTWAPIDLIQSLTGKPVLGCMPHLDNLFDLDKLAQVAAEWELEPLLPLDNLIFSSSENSAIGHS